MERKPISQQTRRTGNILGAVIDSPNYEGMQMFAGSSLRGMLANARKLLNKCSPVDKSVAGNRWKHNPSDASSDTAPQDGTPTKFADYLTLDEYVELIYYWLLINPKIMSVSEFYNYPLDYAPYLYDLTTVIQSGSEDIYYLLEDRIQTAALHKKVDREVAMALLREKFSWEKNNTQNVNLNTGGVIDFQFGDANLNAPKDERK